MQFLFIVMAEHITYLKAKCGFCKINVNHPPVHEYEVRSSIFLGQGRKVCLIEINKEAAMLRRAHLVLGRFNELYQEPWNNLSTNSRLSRRKWANSFFHWTDVCLSVLSASWLIVCIWSMICLVFALLKQLNKEGSLFWIARALLGAEHLTWVNCVVYEKGKKLFSPQFKMSINRNVSKEIKQERALSGPRCKSRVYKPINWLIS